LATHVVVLSDTHIRRGGRRRLPDAAYARLDQADVILHAGDIVVGEVLDELRGFAPVHAVLGNNDAELFGTLPETVEVEFDGVRVAMIHDSGARKGRAARMRRRFPDAAVVVYGHSHLPHHEVVDGVTYFNPASAGPRRFDYPTSVGYLEKRGDERVVKEGFDTSQLFMLGGVHHDAGLEYPVVPLGGINYFNFNLLNKGIQTNVFFAGVVVAANATHPNVANTRTNVGADFFGIAVPVSNTMYRNGLERVDETVKSVPLGLNFRVGHPVFGFGKVDVSFGVQHFTYQRAEDTAPSFSVPSDTFVYTPGISAQYARRGWSVSGYYEHSMRSEWEPWGNLAEYDEDQKTYDRFGGSIGKSFFLPKFQRIGIDINYLDGKRLDRFSKYELGFFGARRVHGVKSGSVRAERAILGHLSYGFVFSEQFRLEAFYDHALIDDATAGFRREPFQGLGIAGQKVGPYGTLVRLDIGKTIGRNAQGGFVANVVFLKLF